MKTSDGQHWQGETAIAPGIGVFRGISGNNKVHRHWAHQISIGLDGPVSFDSPLGAVSHSAVLIPAGSAHSQITSKALSIYIDPTSSMIPYFQIALPAKAQLLELNTQTSNLLETAFPNERPVSQSLELLLGSASAISASTASEPDKGDRLAKVLAHLKQSILVNADASRNELATLAHLSPTRFSHWFREETGMPLRSYRKWLRLIHALELAVITGNLTEAAQTAGFADQSHFTRAVSQAFGVTPRDLLDLFHQ